MMAVLKIVSWLISPVGRIAGVVMLVLAIAAAIYAKGRHDDRVAFKEKIERESAAFVQKANSARKSAGDKFDAGGLRDDGYRRD